MTAQQALLPQKYVSLGPSADDLISLTDLNGVSKAGRQHLIELIEKRIDTLQKWHQLAAPGGEAQAGIAQKLTGLRLKRLEIYNTLHPAVGQLIQVGAAQPGLLKPVLPNETDHDHFCAQNKPGGLPAATD